MAANTDSSGSVIYYYASSITALCAAFIDQWTTCVTVGQNLLTIPAGVFSIIQLY